MYQDELKYVTRWVKVCIKMS